MEEIELTISELFHIIEMEEKHTFILEEEYIQDMSIQIQNEQSEWINVKGLIKKEDNVIKLEVNGDIELICAETHLIMTEDKTLKYAKDIENGDRLFHTRESFAIVTNKEYIGEKIAVYDMEVDSTTHLYQTVDGLVHHNTLLTSAIIKYANMLNMKTITIVPSSSLLKQTYDYVKQFDIPIGMYGSGKKETDKPNIVATWQTLQNDKPFMRNFECVIWDEVHGAKAFVAQQIMQEATNSFMRLGLTGTVPKDALDKANLTAAFGPILYDVKAHELQKRKILATIDINILTLKYPNEYKHAFIDWHEETAFLQANEMFQNFIKALVGNLEGNTLILMKNIDPAEELSEVLECDYISSKLSIDKRKEKFDLFQHGANHMAIGTYSLLSTGIDIVHIHNLILAPTPGKSFTKTIQSIGRGLRRKSGQKEHVTIFDLTSNLKYDSKHIKSRKDFYKEARYPVQTDTFDMEIFDIKKGNKGK